MKENEADLKMQREELQAANEELEEKSEELISQTEELKASNEEMEEQSELMRQQKEFIESKNTDLLKAQKELEDKSSELEKASQYKSEFLANMSHELRTPLNSLLILSETLKSNDEKNLTDEQIQNAEIIYQGGRELLELINDILDLSKVEAGQLGITLDQAPFDGFLSLMKTKFSPVLERKGIAFETYLDDALPACIESDGMRVEQILKNLLSNASKFTEKGSVSLEIRKEKNPDFLISADLKERDLVCFSVVDTGIGINKEKQNAIFEAFQQADGATTRKYGGTGLGLTISKELARLLGGEVSMESEIGKGSTFRLLLPLTAEGILAPQPDEQVSTETPAAEIEKATKSVFSQFISDDRQTLKSDEKTILVIEDDRNFSKIVKEASNRKGFKTIVTDKGKEGIAMAQYYQPTAIILDLRLPDINGMEVLKILKDDPKTSQIPIHIISGSADDSILEKGATNV
ncbi:MAG: signal transduction histidine kinase, partial [Candidatus Marinamargulisbacteria bacterium]